MPNTNKTTDKTKGISVEDDALKLIALPIVVRAESPCSPIALVSIDGGFFKSIEITFGIANKITNGIQLTDIGAFIFIIGFL